MDTEMKNQGNAWLTCDELAFVRGLGTYTDAGLKLSRLVWLQRYVEASALRQDWGKIDKTTVMKEATRLLRAEQRQQKKAKAA